MASLPNDDGVDKRREICTKLENLRHNLIDLERRIEDARSQGKILLASALIERRAAYLMREAHLENELETKYNFAYRRYL
ncbi:hypothetical protein P3L10_029090 [Capsicum annuum]